MFATHYSDLEKLVKARGQAALKTDAVISEDGSLTPVYSVTEGVAKHSFAVAVARTAGVPNVVLDEAIRKWQELKEQIN
jgi:DNA mismatch repair ATPase MutS